jgi:N-acetylglucosaminyl-diphospho-decaprenol L-rhamnosyltransferase
MSYGLSARSSMRADPPLTVIVLTLNEERDLPICLASVADLPARVVVLDSGSTDRTVAIAREYGATVHTRPFTGYASQRNAALALTETPWVLFLDADERLTPAGAAEIAAIVGAPIDAAGPVGYWLPRHNEFFGRRLRGGGWWPDPQLRLLRPDRARYDETREVHEVVLLDGPSATVHEPLIHRNYDRWREFTAKQRDYADRHARDLTLRGVRTRPWTPFSMPVREFRRRFVTLGAWRDGALGLALSGAMAWYEGRAYAMSRESWVVRREKRSRQSVVGSRQRGALPGRRQAVEPALLAHWPTGPLGHSSHDARRTTHDLSVILVSRDTRDLTLRCLAAVGASLAGAGVTWEAILVDNASGDGTVGAVRAACPDVRVIESGANLGFGAGCNLGLRAAGGRAILFLNPDTEPLGDALPRLLATLWADPALALVGPALRYPDGRPQGARRRFPTRLTAFLESTIVQQYWPQNRVLDRYYLADRPADARQDVDWLYGACLLVRRSALRAVGGFDEGYFMYSEELDLCARLRAAGWRIAYEPAATVVHHEGASSEQAVLGRHINFNTSKVRFYRRRFGAPFGELLRAFLLGTYVVQLGQEGAKWLLGHRRELRRQRIGTYLRVLRSGLREGRVVGRAS